MGERARKEGNELQVEGRGSKLVYVTRTTEECGS